MVMQCNVGGMDKTARIVAGSGLATFALLADDESILKKIAGAGAVISLATATVGFCPLNSLLGINSCKDSG